MELKNGFMGVKLRGKSPPFIDIMDNLWPSYENNSDTQDCVASFDWLEHMISQYHISISV